jgi:UDP-N-acetylmuramoylalanine--D-glutamate ligase
MTERRPPWHDGSIAVLGFAGTGAAVAGVVLRHGGQVVAIDDRPSDESRARAEELGIDLVVAPSPAELHGLIRDCAFVVVSPGVPPSHPIFAVAPSNKLISEVELACRVAEVPIVAITGTNGKTTVTTLVNEMMVCSNLRSAAAGNIGPTLIEAVDRNDLDVIVAEVSSFQLALTQTFHPHVATWLNFAEDHLDWHPTADDYASSKAKIFAAQDPSDVAVVNITDPVVMERAKSLRSRLVTFGRDDGDYHVAQGRFIGPGGRELGGLELMSRTFPHDIDNVLAAFATALEAGATVTGCAQALAGNIPLPHRVAYVETIDGVSFYDDSKATTPSAVIAALAGFVSTVLIAGGKNKGLDLSVIRTFIDREESHVLRCVVAIGESAQDIEDIFSSGYQVYRAESMDEAVARALKLSIPGDVVLLSPGCASFDWYRSYAERGDDFVRAVHQLDSRIDKDAPVRRQH